MDDETATKLVQEKMKDMEIVQNTRTTRLGDDNSTTRRSTLDLEDVKKKYSSVSSVDNSASTENQDLSSGDVKVKLVRAKDRNQDDNTPDAVRTVILNDKGILGSQG